MKNAITMFPLLTSKTKSTHPDTFRVGVYALFVCAFFLFIPVSVHAEQIDSFTSDIEVGKDAMLKVKETISYKFDSQKHGIFRCIPTKHQDKASSPWKERYIDIQIGEVHMDAQNVPFEITKERSQVCIKVGDQNSTVVGAHTYEISYTVGGAISYETYGGADLYWNVTGNAWEVPILSVDARISSPDQIFMTGQSCYRGVVGKSDSCQISTGEDGIIHFGGTMFNPKEGLTLAQALNRSKIPFDIHERYRPLLVGIVGTILSILVLSYIVYRYNTRFKTGDTIIPQYEPYPGVKPMYTGVLFDGRLDPRDITAGIVYLAQQGFIKIRKNERKVLFLFEVDDYEIVLTRVPDEKISEFEKNILTLFFDSLDKLQACVALSSIRYDRGRIQENVKIIQILQKTLEKDLEERGFYQATVFKRFLVPSVVALFLIPLIAIFMVAIFHLESFLFFVIPLAVWLPGLLFFMVLVLQRRRTQKGYEALDHLEGFRDFLQVTEKQRYIFHNAPEKSPQQFMEYLPYAIAFGVEKEWAKTFEGMTIPNPNWYDGGSGAYAFSAVSLSQSLGGFSSSLATSSGASASSGGGSSGGGGGGGGGGSW